MSKGGDSAPEHETKRRLVDMLASEEALSGERLAAALGVSRAAVWKHIRALRADGFEIAARPGKGYRLVRLTEGLVGYEIQRRLRTKRIGRRVICLEETSSTNDDVRRLASAGEREGVCVFAERQTAGRGRRGRLWQSVPGKHITGSVLLRPALATAHAQHMSLLAALACARAIQATTGLEARTKWPNDVILRGRKVGGVLLEMEAEPDRIAAIVVGVGINVNGSPSDFGGEFHTPPTTVEDCLGAPADRLRVLCGLLEEMDALYDDYLAKGPHRLLTLWRGADIVMGRWVTAQTPRDTVQGMALDLDADGSLILQRRGGTTVRFVAGDVTINY